MLVARRTVPSVLTVTLFVVSISVSAARATEAPTPGTDVRAAALTGAWTLNQDLSDRPADNGGSGNGDAPGRRGGGGGYGRGGRRGGFGGGLGGGQRPAFDPDAMARTREALRDVMSPPDHLTVVSTDSMIIATGPDGRTTRLAPDGKKIKDENTGIERRTKWDGDKLVSEMTGLGRGTITETYSVDSNTHQLHVVAQIEGGRGGSRTITHVYDADAR